MKRINLRMLLAALIVVTIFGNCKSTNVLSAGSSVMSALGANPNLSTLTNLLKTPGLSNLLGGAIKEPFTLLAPTNNAFNAMGNDAVNNLMKSDNIGQLANLLKGQIVPGKVDAAALMKGGVNSASGNPLNLNGANLGSLVSTKAANIIPIDKVLQ